MVSTPREWPTFEILLDEVEKCKRKFQAFSLTPIPRTKNKRPDKLAECSRSALRWLGRDVAVFTCDPAGGFDDKACNNYCKTQGYPGGYCGGPVVAEPDKKNCICKSKHKM
ncbi:unnamed protein product [Microthlaspi erraticum]|uniref:Invertebrate defensins family profile domain-containing protein n=1 Tax=Microthlaspi erraticum TaxID=1685480 RepID=A0A6D2HNH8_9BRAS|nr:unnamed protein product [Microthlaspi erraticum]